MMFSKLRSTCLVSAFLLSLNSNICNVEAHGKLVTPRSRNYFDNDGHGLAAGGPWTVSSSAETYRHGMCGNSADQHNQNWNVPGNIVATYVEGQEIDIALLITAHHVGWFEFEVCPDIDITESCFRSHRLRRPNCVDTGFDNCFRSWKPLVGPELGFADSIVKMDGYEGPLIPASSTLTSVYHKVRFQLPEGVHATHAVLRWHYFTTNSCTGSEWYQSHMSEEFWNCADIEIKARNGNTKQVAPPTPELLNRLVSHVPENLVPLKQHQFCDIYVNWNNGRSVGKKEDYATGQHCTKTLGNSIFLVPDGIDCDYNDRSVPTTTIIGNGHNPAPTASNPWPDSGSGSGSHVSGEPCSEMPDCTGCLYNPGPGIAPQCWDRSKFECDGWGYKYCVASTTDSRKVSTGATIGIATGAAAGACLLTAGGVYFFLRRKMADDKVESTINLHSTF